MYSSDSTEYTSEAHRKYVEEQGMCPSTHNKSWCNRKKDHPGVRHYAQRVPTPGMPVGRDNPSRIYWD